FSACSVTARCSSCVNFTVMGHTLLAARSASEIAVISVSGIAMKHLKISGAPRCTRFCYVIGSKQVHLSAPCTNLLGVECRDTPGAKHRSGTGTDVEGGSCSRTCRNCRGLGCGRCCGNRLLHGRFRCLIYGRSTHTQCRRNPLRFGSAKELLKLAVLRENIGKRLLHNVVRESVDERGVLIDLSSGRIGETYRGADVVGLGDF